jgi:ppGpp synthetase/RelA/SpoT-type nucleotidyltranferase
LQKISYSEAADYQVDQVGIGGVRYHGMTWATRKYPKDQVDAAGQLLLQKSPKLQEIEHAFQVINNWRSSHAFPLNTFQVGLRKRAKQIDSKCITAQRIKRLSSLVLKLNRYSWLTLSEMQDIAGCRAVMSSVRRVDKLVHAYKGSNIKHKLDDEDDYIRSPKRSGYRGIHLIYRYHSDKKETYNGLKIEMQFRSQLQHAWATAVETVGTFIQQALKASRGEKEWLRFFALMGTAIAIREKAPPVPETPTSRAQLVKELRHFAGRLDVETRLTAYGEAVNMAAAGASKAHYFLLAVDPKAKRVTVTGYTYMELEKASDEYLETERRISEEPGAEAVLVSVESLALLRRAYPNYFLDTRVFLDAVKQAIA